MASYTVTEDIVDRYTITLFNEEATAIKGDKVHSGPSPFAVQNKAGPSYKSSFGKPMKASGALDSKYEFFEVNPNVGREYPTAQVSDILKDENLLRDLAITIARRGVVFFRNQDLTIEEQKKLASELGRLAGKPDTSGLHIHPVASACGVLKKDGKIDPHITVMTSRWSGVYANKGHKPPRDDSGWHTDMASEAVPAGYSMLKIVETPPGQGGDTMFASGCALYDKLSPSFRSYLETLTGTFSQVHIKTAFDDVENAIYTGPRGAPENVGDDLYAVHPAIRTNPVTGWKSVYGLGASFVNFNELTSDESDVIAKYLRDVLLHSPEIQCRIRWNPNDLAIWDNHSVYHAATKCNVSEGNQRTGFRAVCLAERPYLDPESKSRAEDLKEQGLTV